VEVEGHEVAPAAAAALLEVGAELDPAAAALELDEPEEDEVVLEEPQPARAAIAINPAKSEGSVTR
jgi:hypothetical protein